MKKKQEKRYGERVYSETGKMVGYIYPETNKRNINEEG